MIYGLPYKGSKNAIAETLVDALPSGENFCDCCCGGGAILQAAALSGKYKSVTGYDINRAIVGLIQAVMIDFGTIDYEKVQLVTKEQFYERRDRNDCLDDWLSRYIASFGFNGMEYLWGENRIKFKYLMQNAISLPTVEERRNALRDFITLVVKEKGNLSEDDFKNLCHIEQASSLSRIHQVEEIMKNRKTKTKVQVFCSSMFDIPFEKYDVFYFDPPYAGTKGYQNKSFSSIMFKALLRVLMDAGKQVFVSEYNAPDPSFVEVWSAKKRMTQDAYKNTVVTERLFYGGTKSDYETLPGIATLKHGDAGSDTTVHDNTDGGTEPTVCIGVDTPTGGFEVKGNAVPDGTRPECDEGYPELAG